MKLRQAKKQNHALTLLDVLAVMVIIVILVAMFLPVSSSGKKGLKIVCTNHLKQIGLAERIWAGDHGDLYPQDVSVTNGGTREIFTDGSPFKNLASLDFMTLSNELVTPQILHCPTDTTSFAATNFSPQFCNQNVSYFVGLDANKAFPPTLISGDGNFEINGVPVNSGLLEFTTNPPISWTKTRHNPTGNILLGDGSVQGVTTSGLRTAKQETTLATNRLVIP
ncbi:MAG TPA: type II secretion system protein [Verrucomicrobiae bacterium]|nr:type II secretion system protein [Verrucomicrobiae bacterium]